MNSPVIRFFVFLFYSPFKKLVQGFPKGLVGLFLFFLFFTSCKHQEKIALNKGKCILEYKNAKTLTSNLKSNEFCFQKFNAKFTAEATIDSVFNSFTISLRIRKDSIIWMSISELGIEGARVFITKDSVKFFNRISNNYFKGDFTYISKLLNIPVDFDMLQSLLVGNSLPFYNEDDKIKSGVDHCQYTLGTIRKYKLRKVIGKGKELDDPVQSIYMMPKTFKISRILFFDFNPSRSLDVSFNDYTKVDSTQLFPLKMNYVIKAQKNINIDILYSKPRLNEEQSFPFKMPDNYEQIYYKEKQ